MQLLSEGLFSWNNRKWGTHRENYFIPDGSRADILLLVRDIINKRIVPHSYSTVYVRISRALGCLRVGKFFRPNFRTSFSDFILWYTDYETRREHFI